MPGVCSGGHVRPMAPPVRRQQLQVSAVAGGLRPPAPQPKQWWRSTPAAAPEPPQPKPKQWWQAALKSEPKPKAAKAAVSVRPAVEDAWVTFRYYLLVTVACFVSMVVSFIHPANLWDTSLDAILFGGSLYCTVWLYGVCSRMD